MIDVARRDMKSTSREDIHGRKVMVNDLSGDAFEGTCWLFDDHGVTLIATGAQPVRLHSPERDPLNIANYSHVPMAQIKFVQVID